MLLLALSSIFQSLNVIDFYFQSKVISKFTVYANFVVLLLSSIIKILLILTKQPLLFFVLMFLIDAIILSLGLFIFYQKQERNLLNWKFKIPIAKELLSDSWPSILAGLMITIYMKIDQVMIKEMLSETQVGLYSAAVRISEAWYFIPMAITSSIAPNITSSKLTNEELYKSRLKQLYRIMFIISIGISIIITFTADFIILNLYGTDYILSAEVLLIHIWASVFVFIGVANSQWLLNENLLIFGTINTSIGAFANMGLNLLLIPIIGINGAAWATLISYMLSAYFCLLLFNKTRPSFFHISSSVYKWL